MFYESFVTIDFLTSVIHNMAREVLLCAISHRDGNLSYTLFVIRCDMNGYNSNRKYTAPDSVLVI
jgi:hypothetical protein